MRQGVSAATAARARLLPRVPSRANPDMGACTSVNSRCATAVRGLRRRDADRRDRFKPVPAVETSPARAPRTREGGGVRGTMMGNICPFNVNPRGNPPLGRNYPTASSCDASDRVVRTRVASHVLELLEKESPRAGVELTA